MTIEGPKFIGFKFYSQLGLIFREWVKWLDQTISTKRSDLSHLSQDELNEIFHIPSTRPRKSFGYLLTEGFTSINLRTIIF